DLVLAKPVDAQGFVSFRRLDIWRFSDVVLGLALAGYALHRLGTVPSVAQLAAFVLALAAAAVVVYALWVALMSLAFWFVSVENLSVLFDAVYEGARYPVSAYPAALRFLFVYLIPIAWTTTIPASALTGRLRPEIGLVAALAAVLEARVVGSVILEPPPEDLLIELLGPGDVRRAELDIVDLPVVIGLRHCDPRRGCPISCTAPAGHAKPRDRAAIAGRVQVRGSALGPRHSVLPAGRERDRHVRRGAVAGDRGLDRAGVELWPRGAARVV